MKPIKKVIACALYCCIIMFVAQYTYPQDKMSAALKESTPEQRANMQTAMMKNKLQLDSSQINKVQAINLKYAQKSETIITGDEGKFKRLREMMSIQKAKDADLKIVFTKEQYKQYETMKDEMKEKLKEIKKEKQ